MKNDQLQLKGFKNKNDTSKNTIRTTERNSGWKRKLLGLPIEVKYGKSEEKRLDEQI